MLSLALIVTILTFAAPVAAEPDHYRYWGQGSDNGYNNGKSYSGWCLATAYTKVLIQSGAYDNDFTPDVFNQTMRERTGGSVGYNGYCYFHPSQVAKISDGHLEYAGQTYPGYDYAETVMDYIREGYAVIVQVPGHYFAIDRETSLAYDRVYVMDSYQWHDRAERLKYSVVPIEEEMYIARGYRPFNLILFKENNVAEFSEAFYDNLREAILKGVSPFVRPVVE